MTGAPAAGGTRPGAADVVRWVAVRVVAASVGWWAVVEGDGSVLVYGAVVVPLVVAVAWFAGGRPRPRRRGAARRALTWVALVGYLVRQALVGGVDVARRSLAPRPRVDPAWTTYRSTLREEGSRVWLTLVMNLVPGTLSASLDGDEIAVHVISTDLDVTAAIAELESRLRRLLED